MNTKESMPKCFRPRAGESGFSLLEAVIALLILLVAVIGIFAAITYSTTYNSGNSRRSQALSVLQKEVELLRSAKFLPEPRGADSVTADPSADDGRRDLRGGVKPQRTVVSGDGSRYVVRTTVDDDPFVPGIQVDTTKHLKEITVTVEALGSTAGTWETGYQTTAIFRRVRSN
jgi:type II secretory pathway pseudopilin PulG